MSNIFCIFVPYVYKIKIMKYLWMELTREMKKLRYKLVSNMVIINIDNITIEKYHKILNILNDE